MGRNSELIRQWTLLQKLASSRANTIPKLAQDLDVSTRTLRRDLAALQTVGFPIYDDIVDGTKVWRMDHKLTGALSRSGLTFPELCALYFSRALLECFAGTPMLRDLQSALDKFEAALSPAMRRFLDRLPRVISAKTPQAKKQDAQTYQTTAKLLEASVGRRVVAMRYCSQGSTPKDYVLHPYRLVHAQGGLYLIAFVPAYSEVRTFAVERIQKVAFQEKTFDPIPELDSDPFKNSLGVHRGPAIKVQLRFHRTISASIKGRTWHSSQQLKERSDGSVVMTLNVSDDYALRSWILGFGRFVRVIAPDSIVDWIEDELEQARRQYGPGAAVPVTDSDTQPGLPFMFNQLVTA
jgi:predicted DNA-binding transcriptional regulator YafY